MMISCIYKAFAKRANQCRNIINNELRKCHTIRQENLQFLFFFYCFYSVYKEVEFDALSIFLCSVFLATYLQCVNTSTVKITITDGKEASMSRWYGPCKKKRFFIH